MKHTWNWPDKITVSMSTHTDNDIPLEGNVRMNDLGPGSDHSMASAEEELDIRINTLRTFLLEQLRKWWDDE